ncbi:MAG: pantoate--beta-alanine ligase [Bacteroidetes bacterium]|nr:MAG: pantoate--beta-alanine ligase [Bacteroidota bacterium]
MLIFKKSQDISDYLNKSRAKGQSIGFVPTMGALHDGHISLINRSLSQSNLTVCSVFVNPTQFNDPKDFEKYPVTIEKDILLLERAKCDILFLPPVEEIYPKDWKSPSHFDLGELEKVLEGKYRPGHFQGVCQVVQRLLQIVNPTTIYLGQKDIQQCMVIKRLIELGKLPVKIDICPTMRDSDGLAMSSRNQRLNADERAIAPALFEALSFIKENIKSGPTNHILYDAQIMLSQKGFKVDYIAIASAKDLQLIDDWNGKDQLVALVAAFLHQVRLIDNMLLN